MLRKEHQNSARKQNKNTGHQSKNSFLPESDAEPVKATLYTLVYGPTPIDRSMRENLVSSDTVDKDVSIVLPASPSDSHGPSNRKPNANILPSNRYDREVHCLPPIKRQYHPYEYSYAQPNYHYRDHLYDARPVHYRYRPSHNHYKPRETYDPRWWYMPINSVHGPKSRRPANLPLYSPPKWYELPNRR